MHVTVSTCARPPGTAPAQVLEIDVTVPKLPNEFSNMTASINAGAKSVGGNLGTY